MSEARGVSQSCRPWCADDLPGLPAGVATRLPAVVPYLPYVPFVRPSMRRTATARGLRRGGAATSLRLPLRVVPLRRGYRKLLRPVCRKDVERCAANVSHRVISPSVCTAKLPVAGCWR